jgi:hypothetical protein
MRTQFSKIAQAATLGLAITLTLSCSGGDDGGGDSGSSSSEVSSSSLFVQSSSSAASSSSGDDNPDGSGGLNISDLPKQTYLVVEDDDGNIIKKDEYKGTSDITLRIPFYVGIGCSFESCRQDDICSPSKCECTDYNGNEHECTEDEYYNKYESKTAGKIENGQISLKLPDIDSILPWKTRCDDEEYEYECTVSFPKNLAWFPVENLYTTITGKNCRIVLVGGAYKGMGFLSYFSESGNITGTECYARGNPTEDSDLDVAVILDSNDFDKVRDGVCDYSNNYDLAISNGWGAYYYYDDENNRHIYFTSDFSKIGGTLEWQIQCDY